MLNIWSFMPPASSRVIFPDNVLQIEELTLARGGNGGFTRPPFVEGAGGPISGEDKDETMLEGGECCG
jgi:hypothetical protein